MDGDQHGSRRVCDAAWRSRPSPHHPVQTRFWTLCFQVEKVSFGSPFIIDGDGDGEGALALVLASWDLLELQCSHAW